MRTFYETTLDPVHRALMSMLRERANPVEYPAAVIENMTPHELGLALVEEFRTESVRIPAGTEPRPCRWCGVALYWVPSRAVRQHKDAVSIAGEECRAPTSTEAGEGFPHFADCTQSPYRTM